MYNNNQNDNIDNENDSLFTDDTAIIDVWIYNFKCKKCSQNAYKIADEIIEFDINLKLVPQLSKKYNFRQIQGRIHNKLVKILKYLLFKIDMLSYDITYNFTTMLCEDCKNKCIKHNKNLEKLSLILIKSVFITKLFEIIISNDYYDDFKFLLKDNKSLCDIIKKKLNSFRMKTILYPNDYFWKGSDYYYKKIFKISSIVDGIIPINIYKKRDNIYLNDYICGHPKASNGWYQESVDDTMQFGSFD